MYGIPNRRMTGRVVGLPMIWETPLRTGNLRDPNGPQVTFAFESFIDELAVAAKADPIQFRLDMLTNSAEDEVFRKARSLAVVHAAAKALWLGHAPISKSAPCKWRYPHRTRHLVHLSQQHRRCGDRRGRSQSQDRSRLGPNAWRVRMTAAWWSIPKACITP